MIIEKQTNKGTIYIGKVKQDINVLESMVALSDEEKHYYNSIGAIGRRAEWLTSRIMVREILGNDISTRYNGRVPELVGSKKYISISHTDDVVVVYLCDEPCGVDIEHTNRNFERVKNRFLSSKEKKWMKPKDVALTWSIKEAAYKYIGVPDIDFGSMFIVNFIDYIANQAIMTYNKKRYILSFFIHECYNICYC